MNEIINPPVALQLLIRQAILSLRLETLIFFSTIKAVGQEGWRLSPLVAKEQGSFDWQAWPYL